MSTADPGYEDIVEGLKNEMYRLKKELKDDDRFSDIFQKTMWDDANFQPSLF